MDLIYVLLLTLGLRHPAPAEFHTPVKPLPMVTELPDGILSEQIWGPGQ